MKSPVKIKEKAYEKQNRAMRAEHKRDTGKTLGKRLTKGTNKRRVSFACRFAGMAGAMKDVLGYLPSIKNHGIIDCTQNYTCSK